MIDWKKRAFEYASSARMQGTGEPGEAFAMAESAYLAGVRDALEKADLLVWAALDPSTEGYVRQSAEIARKEIRSLIPKD